ncbi:integral membrane protein-like protein [Eremomyces bilateralis CBS 781.70]|uniref:Integral membrane protein-like protein n=1 Tax=Eremomyces bilateralis CBS 781.70 TaxID=1392243 RepID=A0A6G1FQT3_9PEZI|nr:integral membrane protein-like protein [Eremomyces bilateralis CBS 781.70]KAF1808070.1 integral membrane protein-like protein [Eremomyces bilateralis CBS 781.70]
MRWLGLFPILASIVACVLGFLCIFAGSQPDVMEDYDLINVNTSQMLQNLIDLNPTPSNEGSDGLLSGLLSNVTDRVTGWIDDKIDAGITDLTEELGINDFYSVHMMDYCTGSYGPNSVPNATLLESDFDKNVTECSNRTASFSFDLADILEETLNKSGIDISLDDLRFPDELQNGLDALAGLFQAAFILFCIGIALSFFAMIFPLWFIISSGRGVGRGRVAALVNLVIAMLAFLAYGIASAITTTLIVKGTNVINKYGENIGIEAKQGAKFLGISWAATGLMFLSAIIWCGGCIVGRRRRTQVVKEG